MGLRRSLRLTNTTSYDPVTWDKWESDEYATKDISGLELTASGTYVIEETEFQFKPSTKYGFLYNVVSSTLDSWFYIDQASAFDTVVLQTTVGNAKVVTTSRSVIENNDLRLTVDEGNAIGTKIKIKDFRCFELTAGSQLEWDFENLTADQLAVLYPWFQGTMGRCGCFNSGGGLR